MKGLEGMLGGNAKRVASAEAPAVAALSCPAEEGLRMKEQQG